MAASQLCSTGHLLTMDDDKSQIPHQLLSTKLKWASQGAGRWNSIKSHWRRNLNGATQFDVDCGNPIRLSKEPTVGVCSVFTVIRDEEITSRRSEMQPVRQSRKLRWIYTEANEACTSVFQGSRKETSTWVHMVTCLGKIFWSMVF